MGKTKIRIKKDDTVMVIAGKDKGKKGKVLDVDTRAGKVLVDGINVAKRHTRPRPPKIQQGGILEKAMPISISNVMLICNHCGQPTRFGYEVHEDGTRVRICRRCHEEML
ncbi:MAG: 50S ribosomal protein L24 [Candidatus Eremiobacteraeota bacterium]|nr:50S ribosomal protein L24 [Candidatus Eremiobacteraeota bacterium]